MRSTPATKHFRLSQGFTLVELMIALVLGLIVVGGSMALFVSQRVTHQQSGDMSNIQNEGRIALDALVRDLRGAGDFGCTVNNNNRIINTVSLFDPANGGIFGFKDTAAMGRTAPVPPPPSTPITPSADFPLRGSQTVASFNPKGSVLATVGIYGMISALNAPANGTVNSLVLTGSPAVQPGDVLVVSDCVSASIFEASKVATALGVTTVQHNASVNTGGMGNGNNAPGLGANYPRGATVGRLDVIWWFYAENITVDGQQLSGLFRMSARDNTPLLVSNRVTSLAVNYTLPNGTVQNTLNAAGETWASPTSANLTVTVRSDKRSKAVKGSLGDFDTIPLQTSVGLRNRVVN